MQKRHQLRHLAMRGDQPVIDIARMRRRVADAGQPRQPCEDADQLAKAPLAASIRCRAVIGIDVLAQQRDLARSIGDKAARLGDDLGGRTRIFGATRVRDDAEGAELVATLLDRQKGGHAGRDAALGQVIEFRLGREAGIENRAFLFAGRAGHQCG